MKTIIAGSRDMIPVKEHEDFLDKFKGTITEVVSGMARGADTFGENWAKRNKLPVKCFEAKWNAHGRAAGPIRNAEMAKYADRLIAFPAVNSKGTADMIKTAKAEGLDVIIYEL